jgi:SAM-dependent methyltransferase
MPQYAVDLEEERLEHVKELEDYKDVHERHRIFPAVFEDRNHQRIIDLSSGVGVTAQRIVQNYPATVVCNDISPKCYTMTRSLGLPSLTFNLDGPESFPLEDGSFDAAISLATIEHLLHVDHFLKEVHRILKEDGYFYISTPNYASILYLPRYVLNGRSFHNPISSSKRTRYEFYAHVRYFTYRTLLEFVTSFGFEPVAVYLPIPEASNYYRNLYARSKPRALAFKFLMTTMFRTLPPRWAAEPVLSFRKVKVTETPRIAPRKVVL